MSKILTPTLGLCALVALPVFFGGIQFVIMVMGIWQGAPLFDDGAYYVSHPIPIGLHLITGIGILLIGPFQLHPGLRVRNRDLHRIMGRIYVAGGVICGLTAIYMNQYHPAFGGWSKYSSNLFFGVMMPVCILIGLRAALRRDITAHRWWMIMGYAVAAGAGTQRILILPVFAAFGMPGDPWLGLLLWLAWGINICFALWWLGPRPAYSAA